MPATLSFDMPETASGNAHFLQGMYLSMESESHSFGITHECLSQCENSWCGRKYPGGKAGFLWSKLVELCPKWNLSQIWFFGQICCRCARISSSSQIRKLVKKGIFLIKLKIWKNLEMRLKEKFGVEAMEALRLRAGPHTKFFPGLCSRAGGPGREKRGHLVLAVLWQLSGDEGIP